MCLSWCFARCRVTEMVFSCCENAFVESWNGLYCMMEWAVRGCETGFSAEQNMTRKWVALRNLLVYNSLLLCSVSREFAFGCVWLQSEGILARLTLHVYPFPFVALHKYANMWTAVFRWWNDDGCVSVTTDDVWCVNKWRWCFRIGKILKNKCNKIKICKNARFFSAYKKV